MWSRRAALRLVIGGGALGLAAALAGCGFRPLYGNRTPGGGATGNVSVDQQLAGIRIEPIANRLGQQLHNALRDGFNPLGQPSVSSHRLSVKVIVRNYGALARSDLSATRRNVELNAFYSLSDSAGNVVLTDTSQINTGYDEFDDPLNDITANEHAQERAALQMAEMIKTRIAAFFAQNTAHVAQ
jgi:LPS-assembly lipoprotein